MSARDFKLSDLLARISMGESEALTELYRLTRPLLWSYVRKIVRDPWDADEVLQDLYRHVWMCAAHYSNDRAVPMAWLFMIARSRALDALRRTRRSGSAEPLFDSVIQTDGEGQQAVRFEAELVRKVFAELPDSQRLLIQMAFLDGYSHTEIASRTGVPLGTVKGRIRAALLRMRERIEEKAASRHTCRPASASAERRNALLSRKSAARTCHGSAV